MYDKFVAIMFRYYLDSSYLFIYQQPVYYVLIHMNEYSCWCYSTVPLPVWYDPYERKWLWLITAIYLLLPKEIFPAVELPLIML